MVRYCDKMRRFGAGLSVAELAGTDSAGGTGLMAGTEDGAGVGGIAGAVGITEVVGITGAAGGITVIFGSAVGVGGEYTGAVNCDISLSGLVNCIGEGVTEGTGATVSDLLDGADFLANWSNSVKVGCPITN